MDTMQRLMGTNTVDTSSTVNRSTSTSGSTLNFADALLKEKADALMRRTQQYENWQKISQKNDKLANTLASFLLKRNDILQKAKLGHRVNWQHFDQLTSKLAENSINLYDHKTLLKKTLFSTAPADPVYESAVIPKVTKLPKEKISTSAINKAGNKRKSLLSEDNLLILGLKMDRIIIQENIIAYGNEKEALLPLGTIAEALELNIKVDPDQNKAEGWFISEDRKFFLDAASGKLKIDGKELTITPGAFEINEEDIYVNNIVLSKWFPADFNLSFSAQAIDVVPRENFPVHDRLAREGLRARLDRQNNRFATPKLPHKDSEYKLFSTPLFDVSSTTSIRKNGNAPQVGSTNTISAKGELAYMTSDIFISGNDSDPLNTMRLKLTRTDPDSELFGPMKISSFSLGDINTTDLPFLGSRMERGVTLTNKNQYRQHDFSTTNFQGSLPPGWEVEVYRGNSVVAATTVGEDGYYNLDEIPVYYGENSFKIISYGPEGQRRVDKKVINIGSDMLKLRRFQYEASLSDQGVRTIDVNNENDRLVDKAGRLAAYYEYGLSDSITTTGGFLSHELQGIRHNFFNLGVQGSFFGVFGKVDLVKDDKGGYAIKMLGHSTVGPFRIRADQSYTSDFNTVNSLGSVQSNSSLSLASRIPEISRLPAFPFSLSVGYQEGDVSQNTSLSGNISTRILGAVISNNLKASYYDEAAMEDSVTGSAYVSKSVGPLSLRANNRYTIKPESEPTDYSITGSWRLDKDLSLQAGYSQNVNGSKRKVGNMSLSLDTGKMVVAPKISYDNDDNLYAGVSLNFSVGQEPHNKEIDVSPKRHSGSGAVSALVYHDKNNNKVFDGDDEKLQGVEINAIQSQKKLKTGANGVAFIKGLPNFKPTDLEINKDTLEDPYWMTSVPGNSFTPRPGKIEQFDFPVVTSGEIDGTIFQKKSGKKVTVSGEEILLFDKEGKEVARTRSEYDGFYLFEKILPGEYKLRIAENSSGSNEHVKYFSQAITIGNDGTVVNGHDIVLDQQYRTLDREHFVSRTPDDFGQHKIFRYKPQKTSKQIESSSETGEKSFVRLTAPGVLSGYGEENIHEQFDQGTFINQSIPTIQAKGAKKHKGAIGEPPAVTKLISPKRVKRPVLKEEKLGLVSVPKLESIASKIRLISRSEIKQTPDVDKRNDVSRQVRLIARSLRGKYSSTDTEKTVNEYDFPIIIAKKQKGNTKHILPLNNDSYNSKPDRPSQNGSKITKSSGLPEQPEISSQEVKIGNGRSTDAKEASHSRTTIMLSSGKGFRGVAQHNQAPRSDSRVRLISRPLRGIAPSARNNDQNESSTILKSNQHSPETRLRSDNQTRSDYSVQLGSFKDINNAANALRTFQNKYESTVGVSNFSIVPVQLGQPEVTWYRVVASGFSAEKEVHKFRDYLDGKGQENMVVSSAIATGIQLHLASYKSAESAAGDIAEIKRKNPGIFAGKIFTIQKANLGVDKGAWYRIMVKGIEDEKSALNIQKLLASSDQYSALIKS